MAGVKTDLTLKTEVTDVNKSVKELGKLEGAMKGMSKKIESAAGASKRFGIALAAAAGGVLIMGKKALDAAAQYEQSQIAFTTMLGSAEEGQKVLDDLAKFASKTPFDLVGIEKNAKLLLAMGIETEDLMPTLKSLGDVSAGLAVPLERLALNFGQVKAQGKLTGKELRDFAVAGVPLLDELAKQLGKSKQEIQKMVSAGKIGFDDVEEAFASMTSEGGKFNNLMDAQSKSLNGMISNLGDAWDLFLRGEGAALLEWGKQFVVFALHVVEDVLPAWINGIKELSTWLGEHKTVLIIVSGAIIGALIPAIWSAVAAFGAFAIALAPWLIAGAIIAGLVAGVLWLRENWDTFAEAFPNTVAAITIALEVLKLAWDLIFGAISITVTTVFSGIFTTIKIAWALIKGFIGTALAIFEGDWKGAWEAIKGTFVEVWEAIFGFISGVVGKILGMIEKIIGGIKKLIGTSKSELETARQGLGVTLTGSGTVTGPVVAAAKGGNIAAGQTTLVGEEGPEIFVPKVAGTVLPNGVGAGGANITFNGVFGEGAAEEIMDMIVPVLAGSTAF